MQAHDNVRNMRREVRAAVLSYPEAKQKAKDATSSDAWGPSDEQKDELVKMARDSTEARGLIYRALWKRANDESAYWIHVAKALTVFEWFLIRGVPDIRAQLEENREHIAAIATSYKHAEADDAMRKKALDENVRAKAKRLLHLVDNREVLAEETERVRIAAARVKGGVSSDHAVTPTTAEPPAAPATRSSGVSPEPGAAAAAAMSVSVSPQRTPRASAVATPGAGNSPQANAQVHVTRMEDVMKAATPTASQGTPAVVAQSGGAGRVGLASGPTAPHRSTPDLFMGSPAVSNNGALATPPAGSPASSSAMPPLGYSQPVVPRQTTAAPGGFDPFAHVDGAMAENQARRSGSKQSEPMAKQSVSDFFDSGSPPAAQPGTSAKAVEPVTPPVVPAASSSVTTTASRGSEPRRRSTNATTDETDAMLAALTTGGRARRNSGGGETLQDLMTRRPSQGR